MLQQILKGLLQEGQREREEGKGGGGKGGEEWEEDNRGKLSNNKMALNMYLSIITLNVNGLNSPTKRHRVTEWIRTQDPCICCLPEIHLKLKGTHRLEVKG